MVKKSEKSEAGGFISVSDTVKNENNPTDDDSKSKRGRKSGMNRVFQDRGVVYLSHIPHGFYEEEMKGFFSQFGHVTRLRLVRSHKSGNSRGYAFIEFRFKEVAQVVADSMNNYLMRNRLLKAMVIPSEKVTRKMFRCSTNYGPETCIGAVRRRNAIMNQNKPIEDLESHTNRQKHHLLKLQEKLKAQGVDCLFQIDGESSKRFFEDTSSNENASVPLKRTKISVTTQEATISKSPVLTKNSVTASIAKKHPSTNKPLVSQKGLKKIKASKSEVEKSAKQGIVKNDKKKLVVKKTVEKKSVEKKSVLKVGKKKVASKSGQAKEVTKNSVSKKQVLKK